MKPIRRSNVMKVRDLMEQSPYGALGQAFVIEAIRHYSEQVATSPAEQFEDNPKAFINPAVWQAIAKDVQERMKGFRDDQG